ncbi:MAG: sulfotransferase domain-containing protein [bacterium]
MRSLTQRIINNIFNPLVLYKWWRYQNNRSDDMDFFIVTLPGSGTHWLTLMIAKTMVEAFNLPDDITSIRNNHLIPSYRSKLQRFKYNDRLEIPRIQHSHAYYSWFFRKKNVILLVRDLRDTLISHYRTYVATRDNKCPFSDFLRGVNVNRPGQKKNHTLLTLIGFLNSWSKGKSNTRLLHLIRFEDLKNNTKTEMEKIFTLLGFPLKKDLLEIAIQFGSLNNMRKLEAKKPLPQYRGKLKKVGDGQIGGNRNLFSSDDKEYFQITIKDYLVDNYGYDYFHSSEYSSV